MTKYGIAFEMDDETYDINDRMFPYKIFDTLEEAKEELEITMNNLNNNTFIKISDIIIMNRNRIRGMVIQELEE